MRFIYLAFIILLLSCAENEKNNWEEIPGLKEIFDQNKVYGSILIYDLNNDQFSGYNLARCDSGFLPASTFKIPNSIIALECGIITPDTFLFIWDSQPRPLRIWEKDMNLKEAFQLSCVPCYQEIAREIGCEKMKFYLHKFNYGHMVVNDNNLDCFWLEGDSRISQKQQIRFLKKLYLNEFDLSTSTINHMKTIMMIDSSENFQLFGKTGWVAGDGYNIGWFVGYYVCNKKVYFVATNIEPFANLGNDDFIPVRFKLTNEIVSNCICNNRN